MLNVTRKTTIGELCESKEFAPIKEFFFSNMTDDVWVNSLEHYGYEKCGFEETLEHLQAILNSDYRDMVYSVYTEEEIAEEPEKAVVKFLYMPAGNLDKSEKREEKPYAVVCPGGAYARQWGVIEGLAIATKLNQMGHDAFVLYYRTAQKPKRLLPKPMDDLAAAIRVIEANDAFCVKKGHYAVGGFSAGAHLAAEWGSDNHGYRTYGLPKPEILFLGYPSASNDLFVDALENNTGAGGAGDSGKWYLQRVGGMDFTREGLREFSIEYHMDRDYPPVYLVACLDDPIVPIQSSFILMEALQKNKIPYAANIGAVGGHSFGVGYGTEVEGWMEQMVQFWKNHAK